MIKIIVNADDFGYSKLFNEKILNLLENGFLKSTTVMVDSIQSNQDLQINKLVELEKLGNISVGLHCVFDLANKASLYEQINNQYNKFITIFNFIPSHLDIHKNTHNVDCINTVYQYGLSKNLPIRHNTIELTPIPKHTTYPVVSNVPFDLEKSINFINNLKDNESCEILCHPGKFDPDCNSTFNKDRIIDYQGIIKLKEYIDKNDLLGLISYKDL